MSDGKMGCSGVKAFRCRVCIKIEDESTRCTVNEIMKNVVWEICMLRSVGGRGPNV